MSNRERLPNRRAGLTTVVPFGPHKLHASYGMYNDGRLGEVFVSGGKVGSDTRVASLEAAVLASIALQHGAGVRELLEALPRDAEGQPEGLLGRCLAKWIEIAEAVSS